MSIPKKIELAVFARDNYTCQGCGRVLPTKYNRGPGDGFDYLVVDHKYGAENGDDALSKYQTLCWPCNSSKAGRGQYVFDLSIALKRLGRCVAYYPSLARIVGLKASIFLCQLIYWTPKGRHEKGEGWIYKSVEEMEEETGLSYKEQQLCRKSLVKQGVMQEFYDRVEHRLFFRVMAEGLNRKGGHLTDGHIPKSNIPPDQKSDGTLPKVSSYKEQEITQETTTGEKSCVSAETLKLTPPDDKDTRHVDTLAYFYKTFCDVNEVDSIPNMKAFTANLKAFLRDHTAKSYPQQRINLCIDNWAHSHPKWHTHEKPWTIILHIAKFSKGALDEYATQIGVRTNGKPEGTAQKRTARNLETVQRVIGGIREKAGANSALTSGDSGSDASGDAK